MADNTSQDNQSQGNIKPEYNTGTSGLNMDQSVNQVPKGSLTYALNANMENFDASSVNYQNEQGNEFCVQFPLDFILIGTHFIAEQNKHIFFLVNPVTGYSQIGYMDNNDCQYKIYINATCLNFNVNYPIHKVVHKITNCTTEIYWTDGFNPRRYLDINNIPYILAPGSTLCDPSFSNQVDCNQLKMQPNFNIPLLNVVDVISGGSLTAGTVQFAVQYSDAIGNPYTSYYSVTNPTPIADIHITTPNFNYEVGKSVIVDVSNLDVTGQFQYFNLAVIKTINSITSVELVGTYYIEADSRKITYTGQNQTQIRLTIYDIFEKHPYYEIAQDLTAVRDILVWDQLTSIDRINFQEIASNITLQWETYRIPSTENYADELNATNLRGYLRDEVYAFEIVFLLKNGKQTDGFHIPGRLPSFNEAFPDVPNTNPDFIGEGTSAPYWKIYNTASVTGTSGGFTSDPAYKGPYQYGEFAYWESLDTYPCNQALWGDLAGQPIRHHKFPDVLVSPIFESAIFVDSTSMVMQNDAVFPISVKVNNSEIITLINTSSLTDDQKADIIGFKIVRGDRSTNKSIVAKGILRNVGEYVKEEQTYYYPNYPYNDLDDDPFLTVANTAYTQICDSYIIVPSEEGTFQYTDCNTFLPVVVDMVLNPGQTPDTPKNDRKKYEVCSCTKPISLTGKASIGPGNYDVIFVPFGYIFTSLYANYIRYFTSDNTISIADDFWVPGFAESCNNPDNFGSNCFEGEGVYVLSEIGGTLYYKDIPSQAVDGQEIVPFITQAPNEMLFTDDGKVKVGRRTSLPCSLEQSLPGPKSSYRQVFNSPETSFAQPFLGNVLKLENVLFGKGKSHFVQVKNNANYKLLSKEAQYDALKSSAGVAGITGSDFNAAAMFTCYQAYLTIYVNGITRKNYAYSYNSIASYNYSASIENNLGIKQREIDLTQYLIPGVQNVGDIHNINNFQRESSVYIKTIEERDGIPVVALPFPSKTASLLDGNGDSIVTDHSRITISSCNACSAPAKDQDISVVSYYASMKNIFDNQWGQIYSYETIDTGFQVDFRNQESLIKSNIFGGDTFISRFAFKTKLPFFFDNRVGAPDDSDIFYDEIGNVSYPRYWHSSRSILENYNEIGLPNGLSNIISYKAHNFDCPNDPSKFLAPDDALAPTGIAGTLRTFYNGYFYLFAYGVPNFYCESSYNVDLRQAFDNKAGDFWPHVSTSIPDDWVQESYVSIANDNTYTYNVTFSKQNKENTFTHLPPDWESKLCFTNYPFRTIYSDTATENADNRVNNWLIYRPVSMFDFPQNYGKLVSLDGIQNKAILARFENKSLLYNTLLTVQTSNPQAAYLGNDTLFKSAPPIDFAETDLGYMGSQNKFLLKIPQGQITADAKRGQIFLVEGNQATDLTAFGSGVNRFMTDHLAFEILRWFPNVNVDNHFNGIGLHGVYDSKFDRIIITKLDYIPLDPDIKYDEETKEFYIETFQFLDPIITTTTTTTVFCNVWTYNIDIYNCNDCTQTGGGGICNSQELTVGKWYLWNGFKILITGFVSCSVGTCEFNILDSSQENNCSDLICP